MTNISKLLRGFDDLEEKRRVLTAELQPKFHDLFKPLLDRHPIIESLFFYAYTPYFMDGDECLFGVHELRGNVVGLDDIDDYELFDRYSAETFETALKLLRDGEEPQGSWTPNGYDTYGDYFRKSQAYLLELGVAKLTEILAASHDGQEYLNLLDSIPDNVIKDMFGDHVVVTITREGVTADPCDHD